MANYPELPKDLTPSPASFDAAADLITNAYRDINKGRIAPQMDTSADRSRHRRYRL